MPLPDDTQRRLLDMAGQVFAEKGFQAATVREICQRAEANVAAVNYHFGDKEGLYFEAVKQAFAGSGEPKPLPDFPAGMPPAEKLRRFIEHFVVGLLGDQRPAWHQPLMARELSQPTSACIKLVRAFARPHFELALSILDEIVPANTPAERRHLIAFSIIGQCVHHRCGSAIVRQLVGEDEFAGYDAARLAEHIAAFSLAALGLTPPLGGPRRGR